MFLRNFFFQKRYHFVGLSKKVLEKGIKTSPILLLKYSKSIFFLKKTEIFNKSYTIYRK